MCSSHVSSCAHDEVLLQRKSDRYRGTADTEQASARSIWLMPPSSAPKRADSASLQERKCLAPDPTGKSNSTRICSIYVEFAVAFSFRPPNSRSSKGSFRKTIHTDHSHRAPSLKYLSFFLSEIMIHYRRPVSIRGALRDRHGR